MSVYYNDIDPFCCAVLKKNIERGLLPGGYVDGRDIREVQASELVGYQHVHLFAGIGGFPLAFERAGYPQHLRTITGGFPCQDISNAGKQAGITGERSGLWNEMYRLICDLRPDDIVVENVGALVNRGLSTVLGNLAQAGYDAQWRCLRASDFGAPHQRERIFIVAYPACNAWQLQQSQWENIRNKPTINGPSRLTLAHSTEQGLQERRSSRFTTSETQAAAGMDTEPERCQECDIATISGDQRRDSRYVETYRLSGQSQSILGRDASRLSHWLDRYRWPAGPGQPQHEWEPPRVIGKQAHRVARLKALGNAIVPQCAEYIARCIMAGEGV